MFFTKLPNGELKKREWLMYSNTTGCLYCVPCKLFHPRSDSSFCKGFNDWKNCIRLKEHEQSAEYRFNIKTFVLLGNVLGKIDSSLHEPYHKEIVCYNEWLMRSSFLVLVGYHFVERMKYLVPQEMEISWEHQSLLQSTMIS